MISTLFQVIGSIVIFFSIPFSILGVMVTFRMFKDKVFEEEFFDWIESWEVE